MREGILSIALVHHPVYDKNRKVVTTAVTNLDIHDIARAARTFGAERYYIVTPVKEQQSLVNSITAHWLEGWGATYNPKRKQALELLTVRSSLDDVIEDMADRYGKKPIVVVTGAAGHIRCVTSAELGRRIASGDEKYLLLFGTGWGMTEEIFNSADLVLEPITGCGDYNHLSVRSAVSIYLDRLAGQR